MFRIVATVSNEHPHRLLAVQEGPTPDDHLVRVIDVPLGIVYPPMDGKAFLARSLVWVALEEFNEPTDLDEFLLVHPEIQDLDTDEKFHLWQQNNPRSQEPPVDPSNTIGAYLRRMESLGLHTPEERRAYNEKVRARRREEMAHRRAERG